VQLAVDFDAQIDVLVFGDRLVRITDLAQDLMQYDVAETRRTAAILDFREAQQRRDDRERLIDADNSLVRDLLGAVPAWLRAPPAQSSTGRVSGGVRRSWAISLPTPESALIIVSISSSISFDNRRKSGQGLVDVPTGQAFARITRNDALNPLVDLLHTFLGADTQPGSGQKAKAERRHETQRLSDHLRNLSRLVDVASDRQQVAVL
jgi:hypothetical protein